MLKNFKFNAETKKMRLNRKSQTDLPKHKKNFFNTEECSCSLDTIKKYHKQAVTENDTLFEEICLCLGRYFKAGIKSPK